jgi:hypothetical protein
MKKCLIIGAIIAASFILSNSAMAVDTTINVTPLKCQQLKYKEAQTKRNQDKKTALTTYNTALKKATTDYKASLKAANATYQSSLKTNRETYQAALKIAKEAKPAEQTKVARTTYTAANKAALTIVKTARTKTNTDYKAIRLQVQKLYQQKLKDIQAQYNESIKKAKVDCRIQNLVVSGDTAKPNIELDIRTPKNSFNVNESLKDSNYYLKYNGKSFNGLILYGESREGLIKTSYSATRGNIQTGDFDHPDTMPGMKVSMYSTKRDGTPNTFDCDGTYVYSISVYNCESVDKSLGTNDCGNGGWPPTISLNDIAAKVSPLQTKSKSISVVCDGVANCCTNLAYSCTRDKDCIEGYGCLSNKCIKK